MEESILITEDMLEKRVDFEKNMPRIASVSLILVLLNTLFFIAELFAGSLISREAIIASGALYRPLVLKGEWWRIITAMFMHGSIGHLLGNCLILYILGMVCEYIYKSKQFIILYFLSGVGGSICSLLAGRGPVVGASGAIFGLLSCSAVFFYKHKDRLILKDKRLGFVLAFWAGFEVLIGFFVPYIDNFSHIGGALGGISASYLLKPRIFSEV